MRIPFREKREEGKGKREKWESGKVGKWEKMSSFSGSLVLRGQQKDANFYE
jgi:hypothetical protein